MWFTRITGMAAFTRRRLSPAMGRSTRTAAHQYTGGGASRNVRRPDVVAGRQSIFENGLSSSIRRRLRYRQRVRSATYGRNALHGPNLFQLDLMLSKRFYMTERTTSSSRPRSTTSSTIANFANPGNVRLREPLPTGALVVREAWCRPRTTPTLCSRDKPSLPLRQAACLGP